ncbi:rCG45862 [Rattus norvegicus]|uniref:RCG45862 n=1 Tax=Rattus norvegicus TaxID=10116 RepID=A6JTA0_RAT|nr:rCG45862 [Rattus norvegicus]
MEPGFGLLVSTAGPAAEGLFFKRGLWVGSWELLQPHPHNQLGSSTVTCAHKILQ